MKTLFVIVAWCLLLVFCWPFAVLALLVWPILLLLSIPFRLVSITLEAGFALVKAILLLPARLMGGGSRSTGRVR